MLADDVDRAMALALDHVFAEREHEIAGQRNVRRSVERRNAVTVRVRRYRDSNCSPLTSPPRRRGRRAVRGSNRLLRAVVSETAVERQRNDITI